MAKYVGRIFEVSNRALNLRGNGTHKVHVQSYNPFSRKFRCKVITSLEDKTMDLSKIEKSRRNNTFITVRGNEYFLFDNKKYDRLRNGEIVPIPMSRTDGFELWSGYESAQDLSLQILRKSKLKSNYRIRK